MGNLRLGTLLLILLAIAGCVQLDPRAAQIAVPAAAQSERPDGNGGGGAM